MHRYQYKQTIYLKQLFIAHSFLLDIDECEQESLNDCDVNANCSNTVGSYSCFCHRGFEGDGFNCSGVILSIDREGRC